MCAHLSGTVCVCLAVGEQLQPHVMMERRGRRKRKKGKSI